MLNVSYLVEKINVAIQPNLLFLRYYHLTDKITVISCRDDDVIIVSLLVYRGPGRGRGTYVADQMDCSNSLGSE